MKPTHIVLFASLIAVAGRWARHKTIDTSMVVGGIVVAIFITIMGEADDDFATKFSYLILFAVMGTNAEDVLKALGEVAKPVPVTVATPVPTNSSAGSSAGSGIGGPISIFKN